MNITCVYITELFDLLNNTLYGSKVSILRVITHDINELLAENIQLLINGSYYFP